MQVGSSQVCVHHDDPPASLGQVNPNIGRNKALATASLTPADSQETGLPFDGDRIQRHLFH